MEKIETLINTGIYSAFFTGVLLAMYQFLTVWIV